jgi:hypothetical protein
MEILYNKIVKFKNKIDTKEWINLIENINKDSYKLEQVERRPHLTMALPINVSSKDSDDVVKLRGMFYQIALSCFEQYMEYYNNFNIVPKKDFITVSKLLNGKQMGEHHDSDDPKHIIGMLYLNNDFEGGSLNFKDIGLTYKPNVGDFVIYPGSLTHSVNPISKNSRYSIGMGLISPEYVDKPSI